MSLPTDPKQIEKLMENLSPEERDLFQRMLEEQSQGKTELTQQVEQQVFESRIPDMEEFIYGKDYLGLPKTAIYPRILDLIYAIDKPHVREVFICAGKGSGKTLSVDSYVWTQEGVSTLGELICEEPEKTVDVKVMDAAGFAQAVSCYRVNNANVIMAKTGLGYEHAATPESPVWVLRPDGTEGWVRFDELTTDHYFKVHLNDSDLELQNELSVQDAELLGFMIGDGSFVKSNPNASFSCATMQHREWVENNLVRLGCTFRVYERPSVSTGEYAEVRADRHFTNILDGWGIGRNPAPQKTVPKIIKRASKQLIAAFLRGLFEADGWLNNRRVELGLSSEILVRETQELLRHLGIPSRFFKKFNKKYQRDYYFLAVVTEQGTRRFIERVGSMSHPWPDFNQNDRSDRDYLPNQSNVLASLCPIFRERDWGTHRKLRLDTYLHENVNLTRKRAKLIADSIIEKGIAGYSDFIRVANEDCYWDSIKELSSTTCDVADFYVPSTGALIGNGVRHHNSTITSIVMARATHTLLCYRAPADYFALMPKEMIAVVNMSIGAEQAEHVMFTKYKNLIDAAPCFRNPMGDAIYWKKKRHIEFPKGIHALSGHSGYKAYFGYNVYCAVLDEIAWYKDREDHSISDEIYQGVVSAAKTRFNDYYKVVGISSPQSEDDFIMKKISEIKRKGKPIVTGEVDGDSYAKVTDAAHTSD